MNNRIRLRHIRVFLALVETRSVTQAAAQLHTAQPAVSRSLRELETIIGCALFDRTSSGLVATNAGERFAPYAQGMMTQLNEGLAVTHKDKVVETLVIGALPNLIRNVLPPAVAGFSAAHPNILLRIETGKNIQLLNSLRSGTLQLVIGRLGGNDIMKGLTFEHLWTEEMVFATAPSHPLAHTRSVTLEQIDAYQVIIPPSDTFIRDELDRVLLSAGWRGFSKVVETISAEFARRYILMGDAIFVFPKGSVQPELDTGAIVTLDVEVKLASGPVGLSFDPKVPRSVMMARFVDQLRLTSVDTFA